MSSLLALAAPSRASGGRRPPFRELAILAILVGLASTGSLQIHVQSNDPFRANTANADILAYWYQVPADSVVMLKSGETWQFSSQLHVYGAVPGDWFQVAVVARHQKAVVYTRTFAIDRANPAKEFRYVEINGYFRIESSGSALGDKPTEIGVTIVHGGVRRARTVPCTYHTICGSIRDIDDKPLRAFLSVGPDEFSSPITVWSEQTGRFSIDLPERTYNVFYVDDHTYGVSTLEMWGWHMVVDRDETFDFVVGNGEVYNLHAWPSNGGFSTYFVYFRPMVLPLTGSASPSETTIDSRRFEVTDIAPRLKAEDLVIKINGTKVDIVSVQEVFETGVPNNVAKAMPAYLVQVRRNNVPANGKITLSLEYDTTIPVEGRPVRVRSVDYAQFYNQFSGYSHS